jgi:hypothetical protein
MYFPSYYSSSLIFLDNGKKFPYCMDIILNDK